MATLPMRKAREILRQKLQCGLSHRGAAKRVGASAGSGGDVVTRAKRAQLDWARIQTLSEDALEHALYGRTTAEVLARVGASDAKGSTLAVA